MNASTAPISCPTDPAAVDRAALERASADARPGSMGLDAIAGRLPPGVRQLGQDLYEPGRRPSPIREVNEIRVLGRLRAYVYRVADGTLYVQTDVGPAGASSALALLRDPDKQLPAHGEAFAVADAHGTPIPGVVRFLPRFPTAAEDCEPSTGR